MRFKNLSYRTQLFLAALLLVTIPITLVGIITANRNASSLVSDYHASMETIISQANLTLDTLLADATKIADLPLLNQDIKKAMITNYKDNYLSYSHDSTKFRSQFSQANRLNQNLVTCVFENRFGYTFDYNIIQRQAQISKNIKDWKDIARSAPNSTYFAPLQQTSIGSQKNVLPMIKILFDGYDFKELGICYAEINFKSVENIFISAQNVENTILIYNSDGQLTYSSDTSYINDQSSHTELLSSLSEFNNSILKSDSIKTQKLSIGNKTYLVNGCYNKTTGWHLVQLLDSHTINRIYQNNFLNYLGVFSLILFLGLILAIILSQKLTASISRLCDTIDSYNTDSYSAISMGSCGSNQELKKLVNSFNNLNQRLTDSVEQNYQIRLTEQQMHIQMLQFQINHHFLYNTLNVIKSLANINNVPTIETIAVCMSDLLRYNLDRFPIARLREEIAQINRYMTIQNIRFPEKFIFDYSIPEKLQNLNIPAFILQPFVENSIEHGFSEKEANCYISISCSIENDLLHFYIADNGSGMSPETLQQIRDTLSQDNISVNPSDNSPEHKHRSLGIRNVHQRITSYYGKEYGLTIESKENQGTIIDITLPFERESTDTV